MKKSYYQTSQKISSDFYLHTNFRTKSHLLLSSEVHESYTKDSLEKFRELYSIPFERLTEAGFIIEQSFNELEAILDQRTQEVNDQTTYHLIINPTLDCNLNCWYCYEQRITGSKINSEVLDNIIKHLRHHYKHQPYQNLKLSFFGGEPFLRFNAIKHIITHADILCQEYGINLFLDFTTNGVLCNRKVIEFLKPFHCTFQITLDGNKEQHNLIKYTANRKLDTFSTTTQHIRDIHEFIPRAYTAVRINYDKDTLLGFDSILNELLALDRRRCKIILKKVWQVNSSEISHSLLSETINKLLSQQFIVDYYSQGGVCFADRKNQALINYDGNVFKCTTISHFTENTSLGKLSTNGEIVWENEKVNYIEQNLTPSKCKACILFPACGAPCNKKLSNSPHFTCFLQDSTLSLEEYVLL